MHSNTQLATLIETPESNDIGCLHTGQATGLFTTSMIGSENDMLMGGATGLFTTSMAPQGSSHNGTNTGLFTTSMVAGTDTLTGEATGLFTTSM
ncbi:MAG: hypothetical protein ABJQ70_09785 [Roseobacter sp.]